MYSREASKDKTIKTTKQISGEMILGYPNGINVLPFLELKEIPSLARICKSTHKITQLLTHSEKVKQRYLQSAVIKLLKEDAEQLLDKHPIAQDVNSSQKLDVALKNLLQGKANNETLSVIESHEFKSSATNSGVAVGTDKGLENYNKQATLYSYAATSIRAANHFFESCEEAPTDDLKKVYAALGFICSVASGLMAGFGFIWRALDDRKASKAHGRLKKHVKFFKENLEFKPDKKDDKDDESQLKLE